MSLQQKLLAEGVKHKGTDLGGLLQFAAFQVADMLKALRSALDCIAADRKYYADCCTREDGYVHPDDAEVLAFYDAALRPINAAIAQAEAGDV